jgi:hypothetical protein
MKTILEVTNPDSIEFTLSITMSLEDWKILKKQLPEIFPAFDLSCKITNMIIQANKNFYPEEK